MSQRPIILDLFCCAGGAAMGYHQAGFTVWGVDRRPQPRYPFKFHHLDFRDAAYLIPLVDAIHASPPCQTHSRSVIMKWPHEDFLEETRTLLQASGKPYVIENVVGAPMINPITLCGNYFGLRTYRHRLFETNFPLPQPPHPKHTVRVHEGSGPIPENKFGGFRGKLSYVKQAGEIMETPWMIGKEISESIPPAYTRYVGHHLLQHLRQRTYRFLKKA